jgi:hypothetical protein
VRTGEPGWAAYSFSSALAMLTTFGLTSAAFNQAAALVDFGGALQRITVGIGFAWLTALAVHTLRTVSGR